MTTVIPLKSSLTSNNPSNFTSISLNHLTSQTFLSAFRNKNNENFPTKLDKNRQYKKFFFAKVFFFTVFCYFSSSAALRLPAIHLYLSIACKKASSVHLAKYKNASCHPHFYTDCIIQNFFFVYILPTFIILLFFIFIASHSLSISLTRRLVLFIF